MPTARPKTYGARRAIGRFLYRHPKLYHALRPGWARAKLVGSRALFLLTPERRLRHLLAEGPIALDRDTIKGVGAPPTNRAQAARESYLPLPALTANLAQWLDAIAEAPDYRNSPPFKDGATELANGGTFHGIANEQQLEEEIALLRSHDDSSPLEAWIASDGGIILSRGAFRFLHGISAGRPPMRSHIVYRHPQWQRLRRELAFAANRSQLYQRMLHPDLDALPASRICTDRIDVIRPHLPRDLKTVLDLGANFGQFSLWLEKEGYEVTAVEEDPSTLHYLTLIRKTMKASFEVFPRDVRQFQPSKPVDILWAMSVLHFFTKTERDHNSLVQLLRRLSPRAIFLEPPRGDEDKEEGRFKRYPPDEFAALVCNWAGLREVRQLGVSTWRRPIYLIR